VTLGDRYSRAFPVIAVVLAVLAGVHAVSALPVGVFYDDAFYVILGKSLAGGSGFRYLNLPGAPAATHYPPGYPALLAVLWRAMPQFPENIALFKLVNAFLLGPVALCAFLFARRRLDMTPPIACCVAVSSTVTIPALLLSSNLLSETLFLALLLPLLIIAERECERGGLARSVLLGVAVGLLCLVRTHAVVLIPTIAGVYLMNRRAREAAVSTVVAMLVYLPWLIWVQRHGAELPLPLRGGYGSYAAWFVEGLQTGGVGFLVGTVWQNLVTTVAIVARSFSIVDHPAFAAAAVMSALLLCAAGCAVFARRARVTLLFIALYMLLLVIWPFSPLRFVWGVWSLVMSLLAAGALYFIHASGVSNVQRVWRLAGQTATALVILGTLSFNVRGYRNAWWEDVGHSIGPRIQLQLQWVAARTRPDDVLASEDEGAVYLYTGRRAVPVTTFTATQYLGTRSSAENTHAMSQIMFALHPNYVIARAPLTRNAAAMLAATNPPLLVLVDTVPGGLVYRLRGEQRP